MIRAGQERGPALSSRADDVEPYDSSVGGADRYYANRARRGAALRAYDSMVRTSRGYPGVRLWVWWCVANALGGTVGWALAVLLLLAPASLISGLGGSRLGLFSLITLVVGVLLIGAVAAAVVGVAQGLVLRRFFPGLRLPLWVLASFFGGGVGWIMNPTLTSAASALVDESGYLPLVLMAVGGTVLGFTQWLVLRGVVRRAAWWIVANGYAWSAGGAVGLVTLDLLPVSGNFADFQSMALRLLLPVMSIVMTVFGVITAFVLVWLARNPRPTPAPSPTSPTPSNVEPPK